MGEMKKCIYDKWEMGARVPLCLAGYIVCNPKTCEMYHPVPEPTKPKTPENWRDYLNIIEPLLEEYENSSPKADELIFVQKVQDATNLNRYFALFFIRTLRNLRKKDAQIRKQRDRDV